MRKSTLFRKAVSAFWVGLELIAKEYTKEEVERAEHEKAVSTALNLLAIGTLSVEDIAGCVGLPVEEVKSLTDKKPA